MPNSQQNEVKISETITENIFRNFYGSLEFLEKTAIPKKYGFLSKKNKISKDMIDKDGYPDFFKELEEFCIVVEAKAIEHNDAEEDTLFYLKNNKIVDKDLLGIAISGQMETTLKVTYYYKNKEKKDNIIKFDFKDSLLSLKKIEEKVRQHKYGDYISDDELIQTLNTLNTKFHKNARIRDTDRSLFFSGLMIALTNNNFISTYKCIQAPNKEELSKTQNIVLESHNLNKLILDTINFQLKSKINSLSKEFSWLDKFSFIKNIDFPLVEYKSIIKLIEDKIYKSYKLNEKQDILGRAYKIFLKKAGKIDNKNIILTPDHIKELMVKLARLNKDDVVLDTCCGSGGFLMESMEKMISLANEDELKIKNIKEEQLIGFEIDSVLFSLACSNMFLHGDGKTNLLFRSSLLKSNEQNIVNSTDEDVIKFIRSKKPTKCIINPPYEENNPILFTKQAIEYLENNGKLIIIMPSFTLKKYEQETKDLLKVSKLDYVIKMPFNIFSEQKRSVATSIFQFTKTPQSKDDVVMFYYLQDDGLISVQHKGRIDLKNKWNSIEAEILESIFNYNEIPNKSKKQKIYQNEKLNFDFRMYDENFKYEAYKIKELFEVEEGKLQSTKNNEEGEYDFITADDNISKHDSYTHDGEYLIYVTKSGGSLGKTHYANGKFSASNLCLILKAKDEYKDLINLEFYSIYFNKLREKIKFELADGTSKLTIRTDTFKEYNIELIPIDIQNSIIKSQNYIKLKNIKNEIKILEDNLLNELENYL